MSNSTSKLKKIKQLFSTQKKTKMIAKFPMANEIPLRSCTHIFDDIPNPTPLKIPEYEQTPESDANLSKRNVIV